MPVVIVKEDSTYKCSDCGNTLSLKTGQLLPPCPRCSGKMEKSEGSAPDTSHPCCG